ncbi:hypothetical protein Ms3S1_29190 [Methylosinus sp. 3S-1]
MPGTSKDAVLGEAVDQRRMVMRAMCADGEYFLVANHDENLFLAHAAAYFPCGCEISESDALREIRADRTLRVFRHRCLAFSLNGGAPFA